MKRTLIIFILICFISEIASAQQLYRRKRYEVMAGLGTSQFFGDIGGFSHGENIAGLKDLSFLQTRLSVNLSIKYRILEDVNIRFSNTFGFFKANDRRGSNEARGYEARTGFYEPAIIGEYSFITSSTDAQWKGRLRRASIFKSMNAYGFTGLGGLAYNVKGNDKLIARGMKDGGFTAVIPVGAGANITFREFNIGVEIGGRYSFSDYLDGYSTQYSSSKDVYYFVNFTFTYKLLTTTRSWLPDILTKGRR